MFVLLSAQTATVMKFHWDLGINDIHVKYSARVVIFSK